jgi:hypothetical protein
VASEENEGAQYCCSRGRKTIVSPSNGKKMWTKWGLNPRPHATELLSQELAKQARYHCAIRPFHNMALSRTTNVLSRHGRDSRGLSAAEDTRKRSAPRLQVLATSRRVGCSLLSFVNLGRAITVGSYIKEGYPLVAPTGDLTVSNLKLDDHELIHD